MKIVNGDLIKLAKSGKFDTIFHDCNCFHMMEGIISRQISHEFPEAYEADLATAYGAIDKLGTMSSARTSNGTLIVNCYTQWKCGTNQQHFVVETAFLLILEKFAMLLHELSTHPDFKRRCLAFSHVSACQGCMNSDTVIEMIRDFADIVADYADVTLVKFDAAQ